MLHSPAWVEAERVVDLVGYSYGSGFSLPEVGASGGVGAAATDSLLPLSRDSFFWEGRPGRSSLETLSCGHWKLLSHPDPGDK